MEQSGRWSGQCQGRLSPPPRAHRTVVRGAPHRTGPIWTRLVPCGVTLAGPALGRKPETWGGKFIGGGSSLLGSPPGPKDQALFSSRLFSSIKLGCCRSHSVLFLTPQQHSAAPRSGLPLDSSRCLELTAHLSPGPPSPRPTLLSLKAHLRITSSRGALCGSTPPASSPWRVPAFPRTHPSLWLSLRVKFGGFMYVSVITTCYCFRVPLCHWPWAGSE